MPYFLGKDAAGIAMEAIKFANDSNIDVVLVDTAGRMQDNEPLMRALAKVMHFYNFKLIILSKCYAAKFKHLLLS